VDDSDRIRLVYDFGEGYGSEGPGTTENGKAVPLQYSFLDGEVTYRAASPLGASHDEGDNEPDRLTIVGVLPGDDAPRRVLLVLADPRRTIGPGCVEGPAPTNAEALAQSIQSDPDLEVTTPVAVTIGGTSALQMDVLVAPGASPCPWPLEDTRISRESLTRLYLVDLPGGSTARVLALAISADDDSFQTVFEYAAPILDSIEFHTK